MFSPLIREFVPLASLDDLVFGGWRAVMAPPEIDDAARATLIDAVGKMVESESWQNTLKQRDWLNLYLSGDEFAAYLDRGIESEIGFVLASNVKICAARSRFMKASQVNISDAGIEQWPGGYQGANHKYPRIYNFSLVSTLSPSVVNVSSRSSSTPRMPVVSSRMTSRVYEPSGILQP